MNKILIVFRETPKPPSVHVFGVDILEVLTERAEIMVSTSTEGPRRPENVV